MLANLEYETWFVAAAESLAGFLDLTAITDSVEVPEEARHKKAWVEHRFRVRESKAKDSPTRDQPAMTHAMDLERCRGRSPSFRKLCRDLEQGLQR